jgi:hypothetical protein
MQRFRWLAIPILAGGVWAGPPQRNDEPWKDKESAQWSEEDAKQVITDSPWAKTVLPEVARANNGSRPGGGGGRGGGIGIGGIGIGLPGIGGMGRRGGGYPGGQQGGQQSGRPGQDDPAPTLTVRWESAKPVQEAELKAHTTGSPEGILDVDRDHYAIAVYGLPGRIANGDSKTMAAELKKQASIKREGKKDLKPTSVEVLRGEDGPVILYQFSRSAEIVKGDRRIEFDAQIEKLKFEQAFYLEDMVYQGKLEL